MKIIISPARFGDGGAAILVIANKNHHIERMGEIEIEPRRRIILRVCRRE
jgi:predicted naringenin-chalcone synthase